MKVEPIRTPRLLLRQWKESDKIPFAKMNQDPRVREYFPRLLTQEESDRSFQNCVDHIHKEGFGLWAVDLIETSEFIGFIGIQKVPFKAHFTPAVEIGWRLAYPFWGKGYATEGAIASLQYGFEIVGLKEIVSFTTTENLRSRHIMEKIGMHHNPQDDFDHPSITETNPLRRCVLYRIRREK